VAKNVQLVRVQLVKEKFMEVTDLIENEDGSCDCRLSLTAKEAEALINVGFNKLLLDLIEKQELSKAVPALLREKENG
jgi:hypothetical protein